MDWRVLDTGKRSAAENMELDRSLLEDQESNPQAYLHFYDWEKPSLTYGCFVDPKEYLSLEGLKKEGIEAAKRPTGGGIVFHNCDLAFSLLMPANHPNFSAKPLENYEFVNAKVKEAILLFLGEQKIESALLQEEPVALDQACQRFCMAKPTKYDVMLGGRKVGGAAQRKTRFGYLHQGSISLGLLSEDLFSNILLPDTLVLEGMRRNSFSLLPEHWDEEMLIASRLKLVELLQHVFCKDQSNETERIFLSPGSTASSSYSASE